MASEVSSGKALDSPVVRTWGVSAGRPNYQGSNPGGSISYVSRSGDGSGGFNHWDCGLDWGEPPSSGAIRPQVYSPQISEYVYGGEPPSSLAIGRFGDSLEGFGLWNPLPGPSGSAIGWARSQRISGDCPIGGPDTARACVILAVQRKKTSMASSPSSSFFKEFAHLQIPLQEILSSTKNFADENLIELGGFGKVYKGQLLRSGELINIVAKRLFDSVHDGQGNIEFWKEISMLSRVNHKNIVSIVGFCDEPDEKIIIIKYEGNGSLDKYLTQLTWLQRLQICVDVARALSYLHNDTGRGYCMIHGDIKSSNILLDENWEAKICDFGMAIENLATRRHRLVISQLMGTVGYIDPVYLETNTVTLKSDVYSFGVLLFEVLYGRKANIRDNGESQFLAPLAKKHYEDGKQILEKMIDPNLRNQMDPQSFTIF